MDLQLLGPIEARLGDRTLLLGARKQRAVLAMLGLEANRTVSADRLAEGLWGEEPPSSAPKMVQLYVSQLRRLLDGNGAAIVTHGRGYELRLPADAVDVARFERLLDESRPREALALWRGEALADVADEPFAAAEIRRLDELRVHAHELAIDADLEAGRHADVIGELEALVAQHPLRERLHAQRMLALYRSERQSEALDAYRQARGALVEQIGVEPGAELQRLHAAILSHDPALDPAAPVPPARPPPSQPAPAALRERRRRTALLLAVAVALGRGRPDRLRRQPRHRARPVAADRRELRRGHRPGWRRHHGSVRGRPEPGGGRRGRRLGLGRERAATGPCRGSTASTTRSFPIDVGGEPTALAFGAGSLWVANGESRYVDQIDPGSNRVVQRLEVGNGSRGIAAGFGALWVTSAFDGAVRRIDLRRPRRASSIPIGGEPERDRGGRRRGLGGERGRRHDHASRPAHRGGPAGDPRRQRAERRRSRRGERSGPSTASTGRCRGSIRARTP